ncbi:MAG: hypothetical protein KU37_06150 [Sulfuricurvum sp. PC08-66]|nr:MAG: hypothetical protein KU37_06150 [Sulfuricurvum sp. PC08-66]
MKNNVRRFASTWRFSRIEAREGAITALLLSAPIYLAYIGFSHPWLVTPLVLWALYRTLTAPRGALIVMGFFVGLLWFYWVGLSFRYYGMTWAVPLVALVFALGYVPLFWLIAWARHPLVRAALLGLSIFYTPFAFNWFRLDVLLVESYFGVAYWQYGLVLAGVAVATQRRYRWGAVPLLLGAVAWTTPTLPTPPSDIAIVESDIPQAQKWRPENRQRFIDKNIAYIQNAIDANASVVILPESNFPLYLNYVVSLDAHLRGLSYDITIITGALYVENNIGYNATYLYAQGKRTIAKKMILVPFGEYLPLPKFLSDIIKEAVFDGAEDYQTATSMTDFALENNVTLRNAICYEATHEMFYRDAPQFIVAISNNAWFTPSIEPTLQRLLITLYSRRHGVTVLHSVNGSAGGIIPTLSQR